MTNHITRASEPELVHQGLDLIDAARTPSANWTSSIAPFKMVGNYIAIAEGKAYVGDRDGAAESMQAALDWHRRKLAIGCVGR